MPLKSYHWVVAFCCFLLMLCNVGLPSTSFNVYQPYIVALPGIGDSAGSIIISVRTFASLLCMLAVVRFYQIFDCRKGSFIASLFTTACLVLFGFAHDFATLCVAAALGGIGYGLGGMVCTTYLINRWFKAEVGTAIGIAAVGSGVASIIIPVCAEWIIRSISLSWSFWLEAGLALAIGCLTYALLRDKPSEMGLLPYGSQYRAGEDDAEGTKVTPMPDDGVSLTRGQRAIFVFAMMLVGAACVSSPTFVSVLLVSEGYDHGFAALALSTLGFVLTVGKFAMGRIFDVFGDIAGTVISFTTFAGGLVLVCLGCNGFAPFVWVGIALFGFGLAIGSTGIPIWSLHLSLPEERVKTVRTFQLAYATGSFLFAMVPGVLKDAVGSYLVSYYLMIGMLLASMIIVLWVYRRISA